MVEQIGLFGGIAEDLSQGTPELEHAYRMMIRLDEQTNRLSESVQRLRKEVRSVTEGCHSLEIRYYGTWKMRRELESLRAEVETLKERMLESDRKDKSPPFGEASRV
jgi:predicted RNase H-like nuclease (RuvC/YqgF family)